MEYLTEMATQKHGLSVTRVMKSQQVSTKPLKHLSACCHHDQPVVCFCTVFGLFTRTLASIIYET